MIFSASLRADIEKFTAMTAEGRSAEAQHLVSVLVQTVKEKGIAGGIWTSNPAVMAGVKRVSQMLGECARVYSSFILL